MTPDQSQDPLRQIRRSRETIQWAGLVLGPVLAAVVYLAVPDTLMTDGEQVVLGHAGRATAAVGTLMAVWWMTEAIEIYATALLPIALLPLLQTTTIAEATSPYANPLIFLFLGGFVLALSMQRWGLERRIALVALRVVGTEPRRVVGGFMALTAVFSMWVSNTATVAMMLPIALSVIDAAAPDARDHLASGRPFVGRKFALALLLGLAVSASIGGVGTLIGTPPNLFLASYAREELAVDLSFAKWLLVGLPFVLVFLPVAWLLLTRVLFRPDIPGDALEGALSPDARARLGPVKPGEIATFVVFSLTALAWISRPALEDVSVGGARPFEGLSDAGIAIIAGLALFAIPVSRERREFVMDWETARGLPWGILLLFGGGLSLASAIDANGVSEYLGSQAQQLDVVPPVVLIASVVTGVVFLTELTSNTATAAALIPVLSAVGPGLDVDPLALAVPVALSASLAFMLPVATPPNAIVFGSGFVSMSDMMRTGFRLNLVSIVIVTTLTYAVAMPVLGVELALS